jgi:hypothetical protein
MHGHATNDILRAAFAKEEAHVLMYINSEPEQDDNARDHQLPAGAGLARQNAAHPIPETTHCNFLQAPLRGSRQRAQSGCIDRLLVLESSSQGSQHVNLRVLKRSRTARQRGDIFVMQLLDEDYLFGKGHPRGHASRARSDARRRTSAARSDSNCRMSPLRDAANKRGECRADLR